MGHMLLAAAALALPPIPSIHSKNISKSTLSALWIVFLTTLTMQPAQPHALSPRFLRHPHLLYYISVVLCHSTQQLCLSPEHSVSHLGSHLSAVLASNLTRLIVPFLRLV
ncbi:hypothetical protein B0F90DRAFT_1781605, partial [Multifurca ochricompacta]